MSSLKGYTVGLARLIGTTPGSLYERQRDLVRAGLLNAGEGRGPGSGVRTTADAVALLLISVLATDRLTESAARTGALAAARPERTKFCPLTHFPTFVKALGSIFFNTGMADRVLKITVSRTADRAEIEYLDRGETRTSSFVGLAAVEPGIAVSATLAVGLLQQIAADAQAIFLEEIAEERDE